MGSESVGYQESLSSQGLQVTSWGKATFQSIRYDYRSDSARTESISEAAVAECSRVDRLADKDGYRHCAYYVHDCSESTEAIAWLDYCSGPLRKIHLSEKEVNELRKYFGSFIGKWKFVSDLRPLSISSDCFDIQDTNESWVHMIYGTAIVGMFAKSLDIEGINSVLERASFHVGARGKGISDKSQCVLKGILLKEHFPKDGEPHTCTWSDMIIRITFERDPRNGNPTGAQVGVDVFPDEQMERIDEFQSNPPSKELSVGEARQNGDIRTPNVGNLSLDLSSGVGPRNDELEFG